MGKKFGELTQKHVEFIESQKIYFVATAAESGTVNLSPKGEIHFESLTTNRSLG
ncbi:hypothetical protein JCM19240_3710 [Vibrio maritimus]|uniref:Uncharacterized protein n=1 Tax=Vibrio maritimus TaxID=990268 RepID=A0A090T5T3_9VIBR|nr:hypothetical protein JCM19240_3710 [Vibrio maritimus]